MPEIRTIWNSPEEQAQHQEKLRISHQRSDIRNNYLVPIYVMWTSDVPPAEANAALQGVLDTRDASGQNRAVVSLGSASFGQGDFSSADWYLEEAFKRQQRQETLRERGFGAQLIPAYLYGLFTQEPWQAHPHWEVTIVNTDLWSGENDNNFVFGITNTAFPASIQSIRRYSESIKPGPARNESIRRLLRHEVGHMFGLTHRNFNVEDKLGTHCANEICTMRQGLSIQEWAANAEAEYRTSTHFCGDCRQELASNRDKFLPLPN